MIARRCSAEEGAAWYDDKLTPQLGMVSLLALLSIIVVMFAFKGEYTFGGLPRPYLISLLMAQALGMVVFYLPVSMSVEATALMVVAGLVLVLVSSWIPIRHARRLRTEQTLRGGTRDELTTGLEEGCLASRCSWPDRRSAP